jgi:glutamyl-tRNA reductase
MEIVVAGMSFRTAPLSVRERASVPEAEARTVLRYLVGHSGLCAAALLSTCNRTEFYLVAPGEELAEEVVPRLARYLDPSASGGVMEHLVAMRGPEAVQHIFRVASGLDSMVIGEAQILGQFKEAHRLAREAGTVDAHLDFLMRRAVSVAKRVRTETGIGRRTGSISRSAVDHARSVLGSLDDVGVLIIGAGETSTLAARRLASLGARSLVASRGGESAASLATELGATAVPASAVEEVAGEVDVIVCSTDSPAAVLTAAAVERIQQRRGHRPLCILDLAVPRDVEPEAALLEGVTLVDLDVLGAVIEGNLAGRRGEQPAAEAIIAAEVPATIAVLDERDATTPTVAALTRWAEEVRRQEVERSGARLNGLGTATRAEIDLVTRSLVRKLLHAPIAHLRDSAGDPAVALMLREVFDLDGAAGPAGE